MNNVFIILNNFNNDFIFKINYSIKYWPCLLAILFNIDRLEQNTFKFGNMELIVKPPNDPKVESWLVLNGSFKFHPLNNIMNHVKAISLVLSIGVWIMINPLIGYLLLLDDVQVALIWVLSSLSSNLFFHPQLWNPNFKSNWDIIKYMDFIRTSTNNCNHNSMAIIVFYATFMWVFRNHVWLKCKKINLMLIRKFRKVGGKPNEGKDWSWENRNLCKNGSEGLEVFWRDKNGRKNQGN